MFNQQSAARNGKQRLLKLRLPSPDHGHFTLSVRNTTVIFHKTRNVALPVYPSVSLFVFLFHSLSFYFVLSHALTVFWSLSLFAICIFSGVKWPTPFAFSEFNLKEYEKEPIFSESFQTTRPRSQISRKHILFFNASLSNPFQWLFIASFSLGLRSWIERGAKWN